MKPISFYQIVQENSENSKLLVKFCYGLNRGQNARHGRIINKCHIHLRKNKNKYLHRITASRNKTSEKYTNDFETIVRTILSNGYCYPYEILKTYK